MPTNVVMPQLGESVVEGTVSRWLKQVGDTVEQYEPILEVTTDKVNTEIPSPAAGVLVQIVVPEGTTVKAGTVIALIGQANETAAAPTATTTPAASLAASAPSAEPARTAPSAPPSPKTNGSARSRLTPVVARMISEYNISAAELETIQGSGENGRISKKDIERFVAQRGVKPAETIPAWEQPGTGELFRPTEEVFGKATAPSAAPPQPAPAAPSPADGAKLVPLSPMRRVIAEHMVRSKTVAPHVTTVHEADMTRVLAHFAKRQGEFERQGVKLTYTPYLIQAAIYGLQQVPLVNAQFTDRGILYQPELNIGVAVAIPDGLIVPVIKRADDKSLLGLARAVNDLARRAREQQLTPDDVAGGTFTLTNYGVFGSLFGTPVIAQPQSAILGVGAIQKRVVVKSDPANGDVMAIRPMVYLALSFDHRLIDGAVGDTFMSKVKTFLETYGEA